MTSNHQIIVQTLVEQKRDELYPEISINDFFHIYATEQILKNYDLNYEEIEKGITEGGGDGGIDGIYTFINGELIQSVDDIVDAKKNTLLELVVIQSKFTNSFTETAVEKCNSSAKELFDLSNDLDALRSVYNEQLIRSVKIFREQYKKIISKFPELSIQYFYCSKGTEVHPNTERKVSVIDSTFQELYSDASFKFEFITAQKLLEISRKEQTRVKQLLLKDNPISTTDEGYIAIASIRSYFDFITSDDKKLLKYFFDANVRDYQGTVEVNKGIKETLENPGEEDFWWLNNGITITVSKATYSGKTLTIEDPQIVNGLQTSFEVYNYFRGVPDSQDERNVLVRVITTKSEKSRLKVIRATNSQTKVPLASLRATESIHRDLEDFLLTEGFYYDRRKNFYKNNGKPINSIVSISYLGQAVMAIVLQEPDYARARPSSLLKNDSDYKRVFTEDYPIKLYAKCVNIQKQTEHRLKASKSSFSTSQIGDMKYHVALYITCLALKKESPTPKEIEGLNLSEVSEDSWQTAIDDVNVLYDSLGGTNAVAKGKELITELKELIREKITAADKVYSK
ncbi:AIPR family protein [Salinimicrobium sediminilitoris]|uniref:AIPR family protein n=1 Tax=Salinimicrobium sediminilitoris TaxID=2876715 RepID=UPI001E3A9394|nr:AIPR family protein [Salinimicrobium sediminilitoris]MCC8360045.1 AIPR family protein [Salinimicrobium sediminilitoris]